jgi:hypothetical protein
VKAVADVGVELRQIYSPGRRSHHPNGVPQQTKPAREVCVNYKAMSLLTEQLKQLSSK